MSNDLNYTLKIMHSLEKEMWVKAVIYLLKYNSISDSNFVEHILDINKSLLEPTREYDSFVAALEDARSNFKVEAKRIIKEYKNTNRDGSQDLI